VSADCREQFNNHELTLSAVCHNNKQDLNLASRLSEKINNNGIMNVSILSQYLIMILTMSAVRRQKK